MPSRKQFLTTGEAAKILGVSPSTVMRRFDKGELEGKRHPVTGKRLVGRDSLVKFMAAHKLSMEMFSAAKRRILVVGADDAEVDLLRSIFGHEPHVEIASEQQGCLVCGRALDFRPDLTIVNTKLRDMSGLDVVRCLRGLSTLKLMRVAISSPADGEVAQSELQQLGASEYFPKPWRAEVLSGKLRKLLGIRGSAAGAPAAFEHSRRWPRKLANLPVELSVYKGAASAAFDTGSATIRDISRGGAFLSDIQLRRKGLPATPFVFGLRLGEGRGTGLSIHCQPVRMETGGPLGIGVEFLKLGAEQDAQVEQLLQG